MNYNPWYVFSYEPMMNMADWQDFHADVEKKVVVIFSWMPQTIMAIKHKGDKRKCEIYDNIALSNAVGNSVKEFEAVKGGLLLEFDLDSNSRYILALCETLFPILGSVASSKYLHFSAPQLFPMWDRQLRLKEKLDDTAFGYIEYMRRFKKELANPTNLEAALAEYPTNAVRGWDIVRMKNRQAQDA